MLKFFSATLSAIVFVLCLFSFGFADEQLTITTYYPSPYGSYNQLSTNRLAVGDTNGDTQLTSADQPTKDGDIILQPQTGAGDPDAGTGIWSTGKAGQLSFSSTKGEFYYHNGSRWMAQGGGGPGSWNCRTVVNQAPMANMATALCPQNYNLIAGGCYFTDAKTTGVIRNGPADPSLGRGSNGWQCDTQNGGAVNTAIAWCCQ